MLEDSYAMDEMLRHLSERYGDIDDHFFINYEVEALLTRFGFSPRTQGGQGGEEGSLVFKSTFDAEAEENYDKLGGKA